VAGLCRAHVFAVRQGGFAVREGLCRAQRPLCRAEALFAVRLRTANIFFFTILIMNNIE
jgi:hypothetical protein